MVLVNFWEFHENPDGQFLSCNLANSAGPDKNSKIWDLKER